MKPDLVSAHMFYTLASSGDSHEAERKAGNLAPALTSQELVKSKELLEEWKDTLEDPED